MMDKDLHIPVFIEGQDDLIDILATAICSICYNTQSNIDIYILDCGICFFNKKQILSLKDRFKNLFIEFIPIDLKRFKDMKGWPPPESKYLDCYARLLIPELKPNIDRAIYLDSDVILLDDIKLLWEQDLGDYELGAVADIGYTGIFYNNATQNLGVSPDHVLPNAGMLLIDCKQWRQNNTTEKLLKIAREKKDNLLILNEDILSIYYNHNNYKQLENRFNLTDYQSKICNTVSPSTTDDYLAQEWQHVVVYHFCHGKPFRQVQNNYDGRKLKHFDNFWFFASMTPYFQGMQIHLNKMFSEKKRNDSVKEKFKLFGFLPFITIRRKEKNAVYKLFGFLTILKKKSK